MPIRNALSNNSHKIELGRHFEMPMDCTGARRRKKRSNVMRGRRSTQSTNNETCHSTESGILLLLTP